MLIERSNRWTINAVYNSVRVSIYHWSIILHVNFKKAEEIEVLLPLNNIFNGEEMVEITWLGRGGQGAVTAAELLATAAINEGKMAIAIPEFGAERRGAPVRAYNRIVTKWKELPKTPVLTPEILIIIDPGLATKAKSYVSTEKIRYLIANTTFSKSELLKSIGKDISEENVYVLDATKIAMEIFGRAIYNTVMLGALVGSVPLVSLSSVENAIKKSFSGKLVEINLKAINMGANKVKGGA